VPPKRGARAECVEDDGLGVKPAPPHSVKRWRKKYLEMVRAADAVTVTTPYLAKIYRGVGAKQVFVCQNAIDPARWPALVPRTDGFAVGFAGGPGNEKDLELIRPALEWASGEADVEAVIFGGFLDDAEWDVPFGFRRPSSIPREWQRFPWRLIPFTPSYGRYRITLSGLLDVELMPLADTPYNRGRSDLKICEYAMAGALPIVSDAQNYDAWRDTPVLFARDAGEFLEHVRWACAHPDEVRERAAAVRTAVLERRTIEQTAPLWRAAVTGSDTALAGPLDGETRRAC
jgi:Glycosyl transferases group 1